MVDTETLNGFDLIGGENLEQLFPDCGMNCALVAGSKLGSKEPAPLVLGQGHRRVHTAFGTLVVADLAVVPIHGFSVLRFISSQRCRRQRPREHGKKRKAIKVMHIKFSLPALRALRE